MIQEGQVSGFVTENKISTSLLVLRGEILTEMFIRFDFDICVKINDLEFKSLKFYRTQRFTAEEVAQLILSDPNFQF